MSTKQIALVVVLFALIYFAFMWALDTFDAPTPRWFDDFIVRLGLWVFAFGTLALASLVFSGLCAVWRLI